MKSLIVITLLSLTSIMAIASEKSSTVIYGGDDRLDVGLTTNPLYLRLAESTAALIKKEKLQELNAEQVVLSGENLQSNGICKSERFSEQPAVAHCSGFLVSKNLIVTAGHCVQNEMACNASSWVFDYKANREDQTEITVDKNSIYNCKRIVKTVLDNTTQNDYAVIELDRDVTDRKPLKFRKAGKPAVGSDLVVIGHPSGLPTKIADGAKVRSLNKVFLVANLDTYGGNSGSAVFNAKTGLIEGILVRGDTDYVASSDGEFCGVSNEIEDDKGRGEDVTLITIVEGLPE